MKGTLISVLVGAAALGQSALRTDRDRVADLEGQVKKLQSELADKDEQIRTLRAELQACREQVTRLQELYRRAITPAETQRRQEKRIEQEQKRRAEQQAAEARRQASRARHDRIRHSMDPAAYWLRENPVGYYYPVLPYRYVVPLYAYGW